MEHKFFKRFHQEATPTPEQTELPESTINVDTREFARDSIDAVADQIRRQRRFERHSRILIDNHLRDQASM